MTVQNEIGPGGATNTVIPGLTDWKESAVGNAICLIEGCGRTDRITRGWCPMHYQRWQRTGDPTATRRKASSPEEALAKRTRRERDCLIWTGCLYPNGYGVISVKGTNVRAHRFAWEATNGPIPDGMLVDHLCHNRACVNVEHLRLATPQQNVRYRRGASPSNRITGVRNVQKRGERYYVIICIDGRNEYFGTHATLEEAARAAETKRDELFGAFSGGSR